MRRIVRGDIFYATLQKGIGSEQHGYRPVVVIQNNTGNRFSPTIIVAAVTGKVNGKNLLPTHCVLEEKKTLLEPSMILTEQLATIDKKRLHSYIGHLSNPEIEQLNKALAISIDLS